jgi:hypothetical protein
MACHRRSVQRPPQHSLARLRAVSRVLCIGDSGSIALPSFIIHLGGLIFPYVANWSLAFPEFRTEVQATHAQIFVGLEFSRKMFRENAFIPVT